jgi:hypothetical protein
MYRRPSGRHRNPSLFRSLIIPSKTLSIQEQPPKVVRTFSTLFRHLHFTRLLQAVADNSWCLAGIDEIWKTVRVYVSCCLPLLLFHIQRLTNVRHSASLAKSLRDRPELDLEESPPAQHGEGVSTACFHGRGSAYGMVGWPAVRDALRILSAWRH